MSAYFSNKSDADRSRRDHNKIYASFRALIKNSIEVSKLQLALILL
jgi:hypothetical protein